MDTPTYFPDPTLQVRCGARVNLPSTDMVCLSGRAYMWPDVVPCTFECTLSLPQAV